MFVQLHKKSDDRKLGVDPLYQRFSIQVLAPPPLCIFRMLLLSLQMFVLLERKCPAKWTSGYSSMIPVRSERIYSIHSALKCARRELKLYIFTEVYDVTLVRAWRRCAAQIHEWMFWNKVNFSGFPCSGSRSNGPRVGSNGPRVGSNGPRVGSNGPRVGSNGPRVGSNGPRVGSNGPCVGSNGPCVGSNGPCVGSNGPCVGSDGPRVGSNGPRVGSNGPRVGSNGPRVGSNGPRVGSNGPRVGSNGPRVGSNGPRVGSNGPRVGSNGPRVGSMSIGTQFMHVAHF